MSTTVSFYDAFLPNFFYSVGDAAFSLALIKNTYTFDATDDVATVLADEAAGTGYARLTGLEIIPGPGADFTHENYAFSAIPTFVPFTADFRYALICSFAYPMILIDAGEDISAADVGYNLAGTIFTMGTPS